VRWSDLPASLKLAALGTLTAGLLIAGRGLRPALPATSTALFHLGVFLIPVNVAAALVRTDLSTEGIVLVAAGVGLAGFLTGVAVERSTVLRWAAGAAGVTFTGALAAALPLPDQFTVVAPAILASVLLAEAAVRSTRRLVQHVLAVSTLAPPLIATAHAVGDTPTPVVLAGLMAGGWVLAALLDRIGLGVVPRAASFALVPAFVTVADLATIALLAGAYTALVVTDAVRLQRPELAAGALVPGPVALFTGLLALGLEPEVAGVALVIAAVVPAGLTGVTPPAWHPYLLGGAALTGTWGLALAHLDPWTGATALLIAAGLLVLVGGALGRPGFAASGIAAASLGYWSHLGLAGVEAADAYVVPVAAVLLGAGIVARAHDASRASSWVAHAPAVALLGGTALIERIDGGPGGHALVAGAVGVAAVVIGARLRLLGPLVTGTALLVALAVHESLAVTASVPTWGWLALGGTVLLTAGIAMDRADTGPVETGRRVVDVLTERYS
jgi:hypothetical protein